MEGETEGKLNVESGINAKQLLLKSSSQPSKEWIIFSLQIGKPRVSS